MSYILQVDVWPFQCSHVGILKFEDTHEFILPIYECCLKCSFPAFTTCVAKRKSENFPEWVCPSEGLHCIVGCVNKHNPGKLDTATSLRPAPKPSGEDDLLKPEPVLSKCEKLDMENGNRCVKRLCIPLKLKP